MTEECRARYPALEGDLENFRRNPGVMAYLFNTLFDIEPLGWPNDEAKLNCPETSAASGAPEQSEEEARISSAQPDGTQGA